MSSASTKQNGVRIVVGPHTVERADAYNWSVTTAGEIRYYSTLEGALRSVLDRRIGASGARDVRSLLAAIDKAKAAITDAVSSQNGVSRPQEPRRAKESPETSNQTKTRPKASSKSTTRQEMAL